ncbi:MAG: hypothetical protein R2939_08845 [Kofleriaceae bacterium]
MGAGGEWTNSWLSPSRPGRHLGEQGDPGLREFSKAHWMPLDLGGLDASTWAASPYGQALDFLQTCTSANPTDCQTGAYPGDRGRRRGRNGKLRNPVNLSAGGWPSRPWRCSTTTAACRATPRPAPSCATGTS